ncbi:MAG: hypothetical protein ACM4D3_25085 [Candidatus Sericytochromatia bacterium]
MAAIAADCRINNGHMTLYPADHPIMRITLAPVEQCRRILGHRCPEPPPTAGRVGEMLATEINWLGDHLTEILDDDSPATSVSTRIDPHPRIDRQLPDGLAAVVPDMFEH